MALDGRKERAAPLGVAVKFKATVDGNRAVVTFSSDSSEPVSVVIPSDPVMEPVIEEPVEEMPLEALPSLDKVKSITKNEAVRKRFLKVAIYTTLGVVLSVAGYLTLTVLTGFDLPSWVITIGTVVVSAFAGAVHKSINWQDIGVEAPAVPDATMPSLSLPTE